MRRKIINNFIAAYTGLFWALKRNFNLCFFRFLFIGQCTDFVCSLGNWSIYILYQRLWECKYLNAQFETDLRISVTLLQWKVWNFFPEISAKIFSWKLSYMVPRYTYKNVPNIEVCGFIPVPSKTLSIKQVIVVLY